MDGAAVMGPFFLARAVVNLELIDVGTASWYSSGRMS